MQNLRTIAFLLLGSTASLGQAQITPIGELPQSTWLFSLRTAGIKIMRYASPDTLQLFNLDLSPYTTVVMPPLIPPYTTRDMSYLTEDLFDTDPSNIEFLAHYQYYDTIGTQGYVNMVALCREDGTLLDSISRVHGTYPSSAPPVLSNSNTNILNTPTGTIMRLVNDTTGRWQLYSLPGSLPCQQCDGSFTLDGDPGTSLIEDDGTMGIYPNPAGGTVVIEYRLPLGTTRAQLVITDPAGREVMRSSIGGSQQQVMIDTSRFAAGSYTCTIQDGTGSVVGPRQLVVQ
ncbi:MAG: T9SS type A sorting domain-containing protein [Flavobacteriales bacterium]